MFGITRAGRAERNPSKDPIWTYKISSNAARKGLYTEHFRRWITTPISQALTELSNNGFDDTALFR
jgi:hypothetical protein